MKVSYNQPFKIQISGKIEARLVPVNGNYSVPDENVIFELDEGTIIQDAAELLLSDGRVGGLVAENLFGRLLKNAQTNSTAKGHDHEVDGRKFEQKAMTRHGVDYAPSSMKGKGRTFDRAAFEQHAASIDGYITLDTWSAARNGGHIRGIVHPGREIARMSHKVTYANGDAIFEGKRPSGSPGAADQ